MKAVTSEIERWTSAEERARRAASLREMMRTDVDALVDMWWATFATEGARFT